MEVWTGSVYTCPMWPSARSRRWTRGEQTQHKHTHRHTHTRRRSQAPSHTCHNKVISWSRLSLLISRENNQAYKHICPTGNTPAAVKVGTVIMNQKRPTMQRAGEPITRSAICSEEKWQAVNLNLSVCIEHSELYTIFSPNHLQWMKFQRNNWTRHYSAGRWGITAQSPHTKNK